ncbi:Uncharacterised protein [Bordetella pertussis]|nr:Uncharacterised protein [Bordetella pertussis]
METKAHAGEAAAAVVGGQALVFAGVVDDRVQRGLHARHGVDLAGQRRHEERVHHRRGGDLELDGAVHRGRHFIDGGDALLGIDEQPFPVQRRHLHHQRLGAWRHVAGRRRCAPAGGTGRAGGC